MKLWGGRFVKATDELTDHFHSSVTFDKRLAEYDILGSIAHVKMLGKQEIIPLESAKLIEKTLNEILDDYKNGKLTFDEKAEDIHMNIETILISRIGEAGKMLHTGRSRNDQVALDMRMFVKAEISEIKEMIAKLQHVILRIAKENVDTVLPGYTHLQRAQPINFAHHLLAYFEMLLRDSERLSDAAKRTDYMPLGAGALAGNTYNIDRNFVAEALGFENITRNSMDAVSDRDFCIELLSVLSILMMHLSRFCEEIILWSSYEFKFIDLDDSYSTGSSIMPQKKNPDMAELIRGKTGRVYGSLFGLLTVMKGLPLAYNKDMQEDKESVFDAVDTVKMCLPVFCGMLDTMSVNKPNMRKACGDGFVNATDAADWLVKKGVPFRDAHEVIGKLVLYCIENKKSLEQLTLEELKAASEVFDETVYDRISIEACVDARGVDGGPEKSQVYKKIELYENMFK